MSELKEDIDYKFLTTDSDNTFVNIELISGEFQGTVYRYGKVSFDEDGENDSVSLVFGFDVVDDNGNFDLESNPEFKNHIGDVLTTILIKNLPEENWWELSR